VELGNIDHVQLNWLYIIHYFTLLHAFSCYLQLTSTELHCTSNDQEMKVVNLYNSTEYRTQHAPVSCDFPSLLLVYGCSYWLHITSLTKLMSKSIPTEQR